MRALAKAAGLSLGTAYYHFSSKEELAAACYLRAHQEYGPASRRVLENGGDFRELLLGIMRAKLETLLPYERIALQYLKSSAAEDIFLSALQPSPLVEQEIAIFRRLLASSTLRISAQLRDELPHLLIIYQRAVVRFCINDRSPERIRTQRLLEASVDLIWRLIRLSAVPMMSPVTQRFLDLMADLRDDGSPS